MEKSLGELNDRTSLLQKQHAQSEEAVERTKKVGIAMTLLDSLFVFQSTAANILTLLKTKEGSGSVKSGGRFDARIYRENVSIGTVGFDADSESMSQGMQ